MMDIRYRFRETQKDFAENINVFSEDELDVLFRGTGDARSVALLYSSEI